MRYRLRTLLILLAAGPPLMVCAGCSSRKEPPTDLYKRVRAPFPPEMRRVLDEPERFVLYSIEGENDILPDVTDQSFHGFTILGKTEIADAEQRKSLVAALDEGISKVTHGPALCFAPRHGIRVVQGDTQFDLVICFECFQIHVLDGNGTHILKTQTTDDPATVFNQALASAQIPLATPPSH